MVSQLLMQNEAKAEQHERKPAKEPQVAWKKPAGRSDDEAEAEERAPRRNRGGFSGSKQERWTRQRSIQDARRERARTQIDPKCP